MIRSWISTANVRAVLSGFVALALVGAAQVSNAANIVRIGVNKIEFKWASGSGAPDGYLVSRSNKGGPLQAFAWVTEPRVEMAVVPGDQITITVAPAAKNSAGALFLGPPSVQSDRVWVVAPPTFPTGGEWLLRCAMCPSISQRSLADASVVLTEVTALPEKWKILGRTALEEGSFGLVWYNDLTGNLVAMDVDSLGVLSGSFGAITPGGLRGVGPADFDRNGTEELVVQRADTGAVLLLGLTPQGLRQLASLPAPAGAELVAARDFTRDGLIDFIWRNAAAGTVTLQSVLVDPKLNPPVSQLYGQTRAIAAGLPADRLVASTGDYDGDGWLDLLWRNSAGQLQIMYLVNGGVDALADLVFQADDPVRFVVGSTDLDAIPGEEIALQNGVTKEMVLVFPANPTATQRMKWLHPGSQWRAIKWDY